MIVIEEGKLPQPRWVGKEFRCNNCKSRVIIEAKDNWWPNQDTGSVLTKCPVCDKNIIIDSSWKPLIELVMILIAVIVVGLGAGGWIL